MQQPGRKVVLYIAQSLDGFIATEDGDLGWLSVVEKPGEDYGYADFVRGVDTVIMGRKTYDKVLTFGIEFPHKGRKCYVWSNSRQGSDENVTYYGGNLKELMTKLKVEPGKDIFVDGGAVLVQELVKHDLIDRYIISTIPVMLGRGIKLFGEGSAALKLLLSRTVSFPTGLVQCWYDRSE